MKKYIISLFVPHLGCPHDCIFCNQKKISGQIKEITSNDIKIDIEKALETIPKEYSSEIEVAFYGGSFTGIPVEKQEELLSAAYSYIQDKKIGSIRISTRPDYISEPILDFLEKYGVKTIELGVQSMDDEVLKRSSRGHTSQDVINAVKLIKPRNIRLGLQMMIGLPGSNSEKDYETAEKIVELGPDLVRIYPTLVIKDTKLQDMYNSDQYRPLNLEEAVSISKEILNLFLKNDILVIRLGLQASENININGDVVGGPFHPAFKELVRSEIRYEELIKILDCYDLQRDEGVEILVNTTEVSMTVGYKRQNIYKICRRYTITNLKIFGHNNVKNGQVIVRLGNQKQIESITNI